MMTLACLLAYIISTVLVGGVSSQEDPWPPLVTICDIMPLIAKDLNAKPDLVSCASTAWPVCESIDCQVASNNDQLELELLPCWQHPAMWVKNRDMHGKMIYQNIFDSSGLVTANIGGYSVILNVTVMQRQITLGFGADIAVPGVINKTTTMIPYRDIPLNLSECSGVKPGYPLMCQMILYMEQYIMTAYSGVTHDPATVPSCQQPDTKSCDSMICSWKDVWGTPTRHTYQFLRCSKPQAFRLILEVGLHVLNETYDKSRVIQVNETMQLNITVDHLSDQTFAFQVDIIDVFSGTFTEIPYTKLPLSTNGCPPEKLKPRLPPLFHRRKTLYKHGRPRIPAVISGTSVFKSTESSHLMQAPPLKTACDVMPHFVSSLNSIPSKPFNCTLSPPPCSQVNCNVSTGDVQQITHFPCTNPPSLRIIVRSPEDIVLTNITISESGPVSINFTNSTIETNFTIVQHTDYLTLGEAVSAALPNIGNAMVLPYLEIPMNRAKCPGVTTPPPMCAAMRNIAQYLNVYMANATRDPTYSWDCTLSPSCTNITCTNNNMSSSFVLHPCNRMITLYLLSASPDTSERVVVNISRSGSVQLDDTDTLISQLVYDASTNLLGLQISIVRTDIHNESLSMSVAVIPYIDIPLNLSTCNTEGRALITTCDLMPHLATTATEAAANTLVCSSAPPPGCSSMECVAISNNDTLVLSILPCHAPPAIVLAVGAANGTVRFNRTISNNTLSVEVNIGGDPAVLNITIVQHPQLLTLGVGINATIVLNDSHELLPYHELPLNRRQCSPIAKSPTCQVMSQVAQYVSVFVSNQTHHPSHCRVINASLCNDISCSGPQHPSGFFNMSFLPCGRRVGFNIASGDENHLSYNHTIFNSTTIHFSNTSFVDFTLEQHEGNKVTFQMDLYVNDTFNGSEVPHVMIPLDASKCDTTSPPGNHTHNNTDTLIDTCDIMPYLAKATTQAIRDTVICSSSILPNCNTVACNVKSNNVTLTYTVLPCHTPPAIRIINKDPHGNVTFNMTFVDTTESVSADILGWDNQALLNVTLIQHHGMLTMGIAIDVRGGNNINSTRFVPYYEIPINRPACNVCNAPIYPPGFKPSCEVIVPRWTYNATSGQCVEFHFHPCGQPEVGYNVFKNSSICNKTCSNSAPDMETATCRAVDRVAQYMTVFLGNLTNSQEHTASCRAIRPFCNTFLCTLPNGAGFYNSSFLPCNNPIGFSIDVVDHLANISLNTTRYESGMFATTPYSSSELTLDQLGPGMVGFALVLNLNTTGKVQTGQEVPYVRLPLNTSVCNGHPNTSHTPNSLIDTCMALPLVARQASSALPDSLTCTSSSTPNCNSVSCIVLASREMLRFTFLPCHKPPAVMVSVSSGTSTPLVRNLTQSETLVASIGGSQIPLFIGIKQHTTNLSLGFQVSAEVDEGNITFVKYVEIPLDKSACPPRQVGPKATCAAMYNISQYANYAISNATGEPTDCIPAGKCQEMTCYVGNKKSSITFIILVCDVPQPVKAVVTDPSGTVTSIGEITNFDSLSWNINSYNLSLNVTLQHPNGSALGLHVTFDYMNSSGPVTMIPSVAIPLNTVGCNITPPAYSNISLITPCDIIPYIARHTFSPSGVSAITCTASAPPNCSSITCSVPGTRDSVTFTVEPCYNPPAITLDSYVNGSKVLHKTSSKPINFNFASSKVPMRLTLVQHAQMLSLGFKVDVISEDYEASFIPYREIPIDHYGCSGALVSPTCKVMNNIAQYMTVFLANFTTNMNSTPDCYADRRSLCNNITCTVPGSGDRYNYSFLACEEPIIFNIRHTFSDHTVVSDNVYTGSQSIQLTGQNGAHLTLNHLGDQTIQIQITSETGDFIPLVTVPLDGQLCGNGPTSSTTRQPTDGPSSQLGLYVAVPVAVLVLVVILILMGILAYYCLTRQRKSNEPYAYRPLSDMARDEEEELERDQEELERDQEDMGREEHTGKPGDTGREEDTEKGDEN